MPKSHPPYHAWKNRSLSKRATDDAVFMERIRVIHNRSRQTYGMPRIHFELARRDFGSVGSGWPA